MVEFDVQITFDGVAVINHSDRIMDMPGRRCTHDGLWIHRQPYAVVKRIKCAGEALPKLAEVLSIFRDTHYQLNVEIKAWDNHGTQPAASLRDYTRRIITQVERAGYAGRYVVSCFDWRVLIDTIRTIDPGIDVIALERSSKMKQPTTHMYQAVRDAAAAGASAFQTDLSVTQEGLIQFIKAQGLAPQVWYANTPTEVRFALANGINPVSTDDPVMAQKVISAAQGRILKNRGVVHSITPVTMRVGKMTAHRRRHVRVIGGWRSVPASAQKMLSAVALTVKMRGDGGGFVTVTPRNGPASGGIRLAIPDGTMTYRAQVSPGDLGGLEVAASGTATISIVITGYITAEYEFKD